MALVDTGLIVRYYIDEAASGTDPAAVVDTSGVGDAFDLTLNYDGHLAYTEVSGDRGLVSDSDGDDQYARKLIDCTAPVDKVFDNLSGSTKATMEVVADVDSFSASTGRLFGVNAGTSNPDFAFVGAGTDFRLYINWVLVRSWTGTLTRCVFHIVVDTTLETANDRIKIYENGSAITPDYDSNPDQNATIDLAADSTTTYLYMFNRGTTAWARSVVGTLYYAALYAGIAFSQEQVTQNYDILTADDDTPSGADNLTATEIITGAPTLATPTIRQTHELTATEIATGAPTLETPTVGTAGTDALTATEIATGAPTLATPTVGQIHALTVTEIATGAPALATATIGQTHKLTATEIATAAPTLAVPTSGQGHALTAAAIATGAPAIAVPTIGQIHALTAKEIAAGAPSLDTPTLAQIHALVASAIATGAPALGTPGVDAADDLTATAIILGAPIVGTPTLRAGYRELVLVTGELTQLETVTGALNQLETVTGAFTQTVTVSGKLLEED